MAKVTLSFGRLLNAGHTPAEIVRIVQTLEAVGVHVNLQIKGHEGLKMLGQLPTPPARRLLRPDWGMVSLWLVGVLASLVSIVYGWKGLFP